MKTLKLDNFILEEFDKNNFEHKSTIIELQNDKLAQMYLGDLDYSLIRIEQRHEENKKNKAYIAYYNNEAVGYISLSCMSNDYEISYGILPKYRKQNLGALLLDEFSEKIFDIYLDIDKLSLQINKQNIGSIKLARLADYEKENITKYTRKRIG